MGLDHDAYCLGYCWAFFAERAARVMCVAWLVLLTLVVFVEKVFPQRRRVAAGVGVAFVVLGLIVAVGAAMMPWTG
jgi:predicted metal-binding membrane protein